jgi:molecular chaperone GrpE (heat shock protein)
MKKKKTIEGIDERKRERRQLDHFLNGLAAMLLSVADNLDRLVEVINSDFSDGQKVEVIKKILSQM